MTTIFWPAFSALLLIRMAYARPPQAFGSRTSSKPHGYYGDYNPCKLQVVPWPAKVRCDPSSRTSAVLHKDFSVTLSNQSKSQESSILKGGMERYRDLITNYHPIHISRGLLVEPQFTLQGDDDYYADGNAARIVELDDNSVPIKQLVLSALYVEVMSDHIGDTAKQLDDDESYSLDIIVSAGDVQARVSASTVWGALYGMETFSQLVETGGVLRTIPLSVTDGPRFPWRGILLDTSNHFISISVISKFLDAMATAKLNVLHWHIVDSYSFPLMSEKFPDIAENGAWVYGEKTSQTKAVYSSADLKQVERLASQRGIRVVIEMDMPGHAFSWGLSEGLTDITTLCPKYTDELGHIDDVPLDPTLPKTYDVIDQLIMELVQIFPDKYLHVGGDEVKYGCWNESETILKYMNQHGYAAGDFYSLEQTFFGKIHEMADYNWQRKLVAWEEVFFNASGGSDGSHGGWIGSDALPAASTVVESWTGPSYLNTARLHGYDGILAYGWYLDRQNPVDGEHSWFFGDTWAQMYKVDPESSSSADEKMRSVLEEQFKEIDTKLSNGLPIGRALGGEASIWTEQADDQNIESQVWPRAGAVAERLWSSRDIQDPAAAAPRLSAVRCLLVARYGIRAGPIWSDYCSASVVDLRILTT